MAQAEPFAGKERIGKITLERFKDYLRLRWTLQKKTYVLSLGKDSSDALRVGRAKAQAIDTDITFERFDPSLQKYGNQPTILEIVTTKPESQISLRQLWDNFLADKLPHLKAKIQDEYVNFTRLLDKIDKEVSYNALQTKKALLNITTIDQTRRMLQYLSACCNWGIKHKLINENPFYGLYSELPKRKSISNPNPDSFTEEEREAVIAAFKNDKRSGMTYSHYAPIVEFWFLTGCRPSEAIGLPWSNVSDDCYSIIFNCSIQTIKGIQVRSEGSKNNKSRAVAVSSRVKELLESIRPENVAPDALVFPSPRGRAINYPNFIVKFGVKS